MSPGRWCRTRLGAAWRRCRRDYLAPLLRAHADQILLGRVRVANRRLEHLTVMSRWWRSARRDVPVVATREQLYAHVLARVRPRTYLEFGVAAGDSMRWWADHLAGADTCLVGFDTFEGIPEAWGAQPAGTYSQDGHPPRISDPRVSFVVGRFETTLAGFLADHVIEHPLVVHLDADLYSSTVTVLHAVLPQLTVDDVVIFDELLDVGTADHEFAALMAVTEQLKLRTAVIAAVARGPQVALRLA